MAAVVASIGGCALFGGEEVPPPCPRVSVLSEAASVTRFADGPGRDLIDVDFQGELTDVLSACVHDVADDGSGTIIVELAAELLAARGPANRDREAQFDYFVTVTSASGRILNKETFGLTVTFPGNRTRLTLLDDDPPVSLTLPMAPNQRVDDYRVLVGFQLSREELEYNRRRRRTLR